MMNDLEFNVKEWIRWIPPKFNEFGLVGWESHVWKPCGLEGYAWVYLLVHIQSRNQ